MFCYLTAAARVLLVTGIVWAVAWAASPRVVSAKNASKVFGGNPGKCCIIMNCIYIHSTCGTADFILGTYDGVAGDKCDVNGESQPCGHYMLCASKHTGVYNCWKSYKPTE